MLARAQHRQGRLCVQMVGRRDCDGIDVTRRELVETRRPGTPESLCERARAAFVAVADQQNGAAGIGREREGVVGTPQACADDAHLDSLVSHTSGRSLASAWVPSAPRRTCTISLAEMTLRDDGLATFTINIDDRQLAG